MTRGGGGATLISTATEAAALAVANRLVGPARSRQSTEWRSVMNRSAESAERLRCGLSWVADGGSSRSAVVFPVPVFDKDGAVRLDDAPLGNPVHRRSFFDD